MEPVVCWATIPEHQVCLAVWLIFPVTLHWKKLIFPSQQVLTANSFLVRRGILCLLPLLSAETLSGLNLYRACTYCPSFCEFICGLVLLWLFPRSHPPSLALMIFPPFLSHGSLILERRSSIKTSHLGLSAPKPISVHHPVVELLVNYYLLQEEAFLMRI